MGKKLQRNEDTKLQATSLGPDLEKRYKKTERQSYGHFFEEENKLQGYRATKLHPLFLYNGKSYKETEIQSQNTE